MPNTKPAWISHSRHRPATWLAQVLSMSGLLVILPCPVPCRFQEEIDAERSSFPHILGTYQEPKQLSARNSEEPSVSTSSYWLRETLVRLRLARATPNLAGDLSVVSRYTQGGLRITVETAVLPSSHVICPVRQFSQRHRSRRAGLFGLACPPYLSLARRGCICSCPNTIVRSLRLFCGEGYHSISFVNEGTT